MTLHRDGWLGGRAFTLVEGDFACLECGAVLETRGSFIAHECGDVGEGPVVRPADDAEALPPGYEVSGGGGGYWTLTGPDGETIEGPSNGKWQGRDGAADAAWNHYTAV